MSCLKKPALVICAAALFVGLAQAQINIDQLGAAQSYDVGTIQPGGFAGGLDSTLWQGITAPQAIVLIEKTDTNAKGVARDLIRAALLSGGVPPQTQDTPERNAYIAARLAAVLGLSDLAAFDTIATQSGISRGDPAFTKIFAERTLLDGDTNTACAITDNVTIERKSPYWAKLRAFCHVVRDEIPAAELTADLLARSGHGDKIFFDLLGKLTGTRPEIKVGKIQTSLQAAMLAEIFKADKIEVETLPDTLNANIALDSEQAPDLRLEALLASAAVLDNAQIRSVLHGLADTPIAGAKDIAAKNWDAATWGSVYLALINSNDMDNRALLAGTLLEQADKQGLLPYFALALETDTSIIPAQIRAAYKPAIFARTAVLHGDTGTLRGMFQALDTDNPLRGRIALASDALGNGFMLGELGVDIETRLASEEDVRPRAIRDTFVAVALGANLSETAEQALQTMKLKGRMVKPGELLALQAAARRGSKAEVALRVARIIDGRPLRSDSFGAVLIAMVEAGMHEQAGRLAALDMLNDD